MAATVGTDAAGTAATEKPVPAGTEKPPVNVVGAVNVDVPNDGAVKPVPDTEKPVPAATEKPVPAATENPLVVTVPFEEVPNGAAVAAGVAKLLCGPLCMGGSEET